MNNELTVLIEPDTGRVTVEISKASKSAITDLHKDFGNGTNVNCGKPASARSKDANSSIESSAASNFGSGNFSLCLYRLYHNSVVDGPGRRSVVQVAGCSIRCPGCYVPQTHERDNGALFSITSIVKEIVANRAAHDGVTILGGEPFDQSGPVAELVSRLKRHALHVTVYSGYTFETLIGRKDSNIDFILTHIDLLIDGPFVRQLGESAGEYRGSRNQRIIANPGR